MVGGGIRKISRGDIGGKRRGLVGERMVKIGKGVRKGIFGGVRREIIVEIGTEIIEEIRRRIFGEIYFLRC